MIKKLILKVLNYYYIIKNILKIETKNKNNNQEIISNFNNEEYIFLEEINLKRKKIVEFEEDLKIIGIDSNLDVLNYIFIFLDNYKRIDSYISRNINEKNYDKFTLLIDLYVTILNRVGGFKIINVNIGDEYDSKIHINYSEKNIKEYKIIKEIMPIIEKCGNKLIKAKVLLK